MDVRELPGIDIVSGAEVLPFAYGLLEEVASSHLVEHFREHEFKMRILPHWFSPIESGGRNPGDRPQLGSRVPAA